jgi:hypothetical protein
MELLTLLFIVFLAALFLKILSIIFHTGVFLLVLPLKILAVLFATIVVFVVLAPLGILGAIAGLMVAPIVLFVFLFPVILIGIGIYFLINR